MAISHSTESDTQTEIRTRWFGRFSRYDLLLAAVPLVFGAGVLGGLVGPVSLEVAMGVAAIINAAGVLDGLYFNPPVGKESKDSLKSRANGVQRK